MHAAVDGSTDDSAAFLRELGRQDPRVRAVVLPANRGRTVALNAACTAAVGTLVLRLDDDLLVRPDFVELHRRAHEAAAEPIGVVGRILDVIPDTRANRRWRAFVARNAAADEAAVHAGSPPASRPRPGAAPAACAVDTGTQLGWYDERFGRYGWEDVEFGYRLQSGRRSPSGRSHVQPRSTSRTTTRSRPSSAAVSRQAPAWPCSPRSTAPTPCCSALGVDPQIAH